jgi:hypothetical protein
MPYVPVTHTKLPRKLKKALKKCVLANDVNQRDYPWLTSKDVVLLESRNKTCHTTSFYRFGTYAGQYRWWSVQYKILNREKHG